MEHSTPRRTPASAPAPHRDAQPATPAAALRSPSAPTPVSLSPDEARAKAWTDPAAVVARVRANAWKSPRARSCQPDIDFLTGLPVPPSVIHWPDLPSPLSLTPESLSQSPDAPIPPTVPVPHHYHAPAHGAAPPLSPSVHEDQAGLGDPATYDPADFRWVPVRRKPRRDGWTEEKQRRFIEVLADTGIVTLAAKAVGMNRESARRLRRSPHGASFARAWDMARQTSGSLIEDIVFDRVIDGVEQNVFNEYGEVVCTKRVYSNSLLTFLLSNLKPERYSREARAAAVARANQIADPNPGMLNPVMVLENGVAGEAAALTTETASRAGALPQPAETLDDCLRALEPAMPAAPEEMLDPDTLEEELALANIADGELPPFLSEQRPPKSERQQAEEKHREAEERGRLACEKAERGEALTDQEFRDMCHFMDPPQRNERSKRLYR